jgi:hypothetical protein
VKPVIQKWSIYRLWRTRLNGPFYIPEQGRFLVKYLETEGPARMIEELERLSMLGSPWASAMLGCLCLRPGLNGQLDVDRALQLCANPAEKGDSYALFVYAWALLHSGQRDRAVRIMQKAALLQFPPAVLDFVTFVWNGWGMKEKSPSAALKLLDRAFKVHHAAAWVWLCALYRSGQFGLTRRAAGWLLMPFARLHHIYSGLLNPFSCRVFTLSATTLKRPFLRS